MSLYGRISMLEESIEELTKLMIKEDFKIKESNQETIIKISKKDLIKFCIKLIKLIKNVEDK